MIKNTDSSPKSYGIVQMEFPKKCLLLIFVFHRYTIEELHKKIHDIHRKILEIKYCQKDSMAAVFLCTLQKSLDQILLQNFFGRLLVICVKVTNNIHADKWMSIKKKTNV